MRGQERAGQRVVVRQLFESWSQEWGYDPLSLLGRMSAGTPGVLSHWAPTGDAKRVGKMWYVYHQDGASRVTAIYHIDELSVT